MRYLIILLILVIGSCKSHKELSFKDEICPKDGSCNYLVAPNQVMSFNYNSLKEFYPTFSDGKNLIFKFEYKRNEIENTQDSSYREEIFIELNPENLELNTTNLSKHKTVFARWCYCKGQTGYYKITQGNLLVKKVKDKTYQLELEFKVEEVPHVITKIRHFFELE